MSVREFLQHQRAIELDVPECWVIIANPVYGRAEEHDLVAAFDTQELAEAYIRASLLPADWSTEQRQTGRINRAFRPDSLLWDYNGSAFFPNDADPTSIVRRVNNPTFRLGHLIDNPLPPSGPVPMEVFAEDAAERLLSSR